MSSNPPMIDRLPPHSVDMERSLLSCMLRDPLCIAEIACLVKADQFYVYGNQKVYQVITEIADEGKNADVVTVAQRLIELKSLEEVGGAPYLAQLWDSAPMAGSFRQYAATIRDNAQRRELILSSRESEANAYDFTTPIEEIIGEAEKRVLSITDQGMTGESVDLRTALTETLQRLDARRGNDGALTGVPTGFVDLDTLLCGFQNSELVILGARPSVGKTCFGLNIARHVAVDCGLPVLFVSLEQAKVELAERLLCAEGRIDSHKLRRGYISQQDQNDLMDANERLGKSKMYIDDSPMQSMLRISSNARREKQKHGIKLIILDYLQMVMPDDRRASRQEQVADTSRRLKGLARELKVPVIALCQVNRGPEDRTDKKPRLSDLRESGAIEADADTVMLLHRPEPGPTVETIQVIVAKQRNGPIGEVELAYVKNYMKFENMAYSHEGNL